MEKGEKPLAEKFQAVWDALEDAGVSGRVIYSARKNIFHTDANEIEFMEEALEDLFNKIRKGAAPAVRLMDTRMYNEAVAKGDLESINGLFKNYD